MEHVSSTDNADSWILHKELHIVHLNIHYVLPKLDEIQIVQSQNPTIDCLFMCETVLDSTVLDYIVSLLFLAIQFSANIIKHPLEEDYYDVSKIISAVIVEPT